MASTQTNTLTTTAPTTQTQATKRPNKSQKTQQNTRKPRKKNPFYAILPNGDQHIPNGVTINWNRGILNQLWQIGDCYEEWINHAKIRQIRMFDSDFLEGCSFTFWWMPAALYIPWSMLELMTSYRVLSGLDQLKNTPNNPNHYETQTQTQNFDTIHTNSSANSIENSDLNGIILPWNPVYDVFGGMIGILGSCMVYFLLGLIIWSLFEYFAHRFLFHWTPKTTFQRYCHFLGHGLHHLTPIDDLRLVFPPAISITIGFIMYILFNHVLFAIGISNALLAGFGFGYACYESTHYLSHHYGNVTFIKWSKNMITDVAIYYLKQRFKFHSAHHFNASKKDALYGVTSQIWDVVFNTL